MGVLNLRGVPDELVQALRMEAVTLNLGFHEYCIEVLKGHKPAMEPQKTANAIGAESTENGRRQTVPAGFKKTVPAGLRRKKGLRNRFPSSVEGTVAVLNKLPQYQGNSPEPAVASGEGLPGQVEDSQPVPDVAPLTTAIAAVQAIGETVVPASEIARTCVCGNKALVPFGSSLRCVACGINYSR